MKKTFAFIIALFFIATSFAQVKNAVSKSTITFHIKNLGINTSGNLSGLQASIQFDPANLAASTIEASVETSTINTGNDAKDTHLKSADFFDVASFPKITMQSVSFKHKSSDNYVGIFNITMKDKTKPVEVQFSYVAGDKTAAIKGNFKLDRTDFGVGGKSLVLSNDVTVNIEMEFAR